ncbi:acyltransferase family protein [Micromonospora sp. NBC_01796]|uniref:acyltransferase family protein n=1 Tax=Micromonospora sp. NBC_01796 TaxID=2975987 RepID=UPI002DDAF9A8|nr:acyltransferase [Micromonospora sp. NBC_01796]WSA82863.1 acyltransferase [Micromonospora sp. NBC_01796]
MTATIEDATRGIAVPAATATKTGKPTNQRLYVLDLLRFSAAIMVLGYHLIPIVEFVYGVDADAYFGRLIAQGFRYGWMGVHLFFIISGFVICMSSWGRSASEFFISRVTRLMPAYVLAVLLTTALLTLWWPAAERPSPVAVLANLTMVQGLLGVPNIDTVYWTLLVELKFYLLFAIVVRLGLTYRRVVAFCLLWTTASLLVQVKNIGILSTVLEPTYTYFFVAGIVLYLMHRFGPNPLLWGMLVASWIFSTNSLRIVFAEHQVPMRFNVALVLLTVFFAVMTAIALGWFSWLRWRGSTTIGALTYPVYLVHFFLAYAILRKLHGRLPDAVLLVLTVATVLAVGYVIHRLVEQPVGRALRTSLRRAFADIRRADGVEPERRTDEPVVAGRAAGPSTFTGSFDGADRLPERAD